MLGQSTHENAVTHGVFCPEKTVWNANTRVSGTGYTQLLWYNVVFSVYTTPEILQLSVISVKILDVTFCYLSTVYGLFLDTLFPKSVS
jgi:hypothetical protein